MGLPNTFGADLGLTARCVAWRCQKRVERVLKIAAMWLRCAAKRDYDGISAVEPEFYARRFHTFVGLKLLGLSKATVKAVKKALKKSGK